MQGSADKIGPSWFDQYWPDIIRFEFPLASELVTVDVSWFRDMNIRLHLQTACYLTIYINRSKKIINAGSEDGHMHPRSG